MRSHGTRIRAAPLHQQDKNGLVERKWQSLTKMARAFLSAAKLPKKFWFWAIREASIRMNMLPVLQQQDGTPENKDPSIMTTPYFEFFGVKPDYRILFPFGSIGSFRRPRDGNHKRTNFESQCMLGIALGRSEYTNGMIFHNPVLDSMSVSADFLLDKNRLIGEVFDCLRYDGGLTMSVLSDGNTTPTKFNAGDAAFIQCQETFDIVDVTVTMVPTSKTKKYTVKLQNNTTRNVNLDHIFDENNAPAPGTPSMSLAFFRPKWMKQDQKVTILKDDTYTKGYLNINKDGYWEFVTYDNDGKIITQSSLSDLQYTWKMRMQENTFDIGWNFEMAHRVYGIG